MNPSKRPAVAAAVVLAALFFAAGCKGGSGGGSGTPPTPAPGRATTLFAASGAAAPGYLVALPPAAGGSVTPGRIIQSSQTPNFGQSAFLTYDPGSGRLWVTSCLGQTGSAGPVLAFSARASGSAVPPAVSIAGAATGLSSCQAGIAVDGLGNVYVADATTTGVYPGGQIAVFAGGAQGNVPPVRRIAGSAANLHAPAGLALDANSNLYVADSGRGFAPYPGDVHVYAPGTTGNVAPVRAIVGNNTGLSTPFGIALDSAGNLYVTNSGTNSITVYAPAANGNVAPIRVIGGASTLLQQPAGIAVDDAGFTYVGTQSGASGNAPILVFAPNANGNIAPLAAITVNAPNFSEPSGIALR